MAASFSEGVVESLEDWIRSAAGCCEALAGAEMVEFGWNIWELKGLLEVISIKRGLAGWITGWGVSRQLPGNEQQLSHTLQLPYYFAQECGKRAKGRSLNLHTNNVRAKAMHKAKVQSSHLGEQRTKRGCSNL